MSDGVLTLLVVLVMLVGLIGVLVPVLPGLLLIAVAAVVWAVFVDGGAGPWIILVIVLAVLAAGTVAKYAIPTRSLAGTGAPRSTLLVGIVGAVIGFFVIPVAGLLVGFVLGVFLAELARLQQPQPAWASTWATLKGIGLGMLVELLAGVVAVGCWAVGAFLVLR